MRRKPDYPSNTAFWDNIKVGVVVHLSARNSEGRVVLTKNGSNRYKIKSRKGNNLMAVSLNNKSCIWIMGPNCPYFKVIAITTAQQGDPTIGVEDGR